MKHVGTLTICWFLGILSASASTLEVYGELAGKTILMPAGLPAVPDSIVATLPGERTNAIAFIEGAFSTNGIAVVQDGPKFVRLLPEARAEVLLREVPLRGARIQPGAESGTNQVGIVSCIGVDGTTFLGLYAQVRHRTVLRLCGLPSPVFSFRTRGRLTAEEAGYAMEVVLALNGIAVLDDGEKLIQAVPFGERARMKAGAPKPDPTAKLLDPNRVPSLTLPTTPRLMSPMERDFERLRKALYDFMHYRDPRDDRSAGRLLRLYGVLAEKKVTKSPNFDGVPVWFHIETPLTRNELLYAIEATFALNYMVIIQVDDRTVRLGHITELSNGSPRSTRPPSGLERQGS